jgi:hypothetical protein
MQNLCFVFFKLLIGIVFTPNDLWCWRLGRMFTSALVTSGGVIFWEAIFMVAISVGPAEWMTGWRWTAATFGGIYLPVLALTTVIALLLLHQLRAFGLDAYVAACDVGPSEGYFTCQGLVNAR